MDLLKQTYKEQKYQREVNYDNSLFPFRSTIQKNRIRLVRPHWHSAIEMIVVQKGPVLCKVEDQSFIAQEGDILFLDSYVMHSIYSCNESDKMIHGIVFQPELLEERLVNLQNYYGSCSNVYDQKLCVFPNGHKVNQIIAPHLDQLHHDYKTQDPFCQMSIKGHLYLILSTIYRYQMQQLHTSKTQTELKKRADRLTPVFSYIEHNYRDYIEVAALCRLVNMSPGYFNHYFKSIVAMTPMEYLNQYRIHIACSLLSNSNDTITEIAQAVGYNTVNYFNRVFKSVCGMTPSQFRKN